MRLIPLPRPRLPRPPERRLLLAASVAALLALLLGLGIRLSAPAPAAAAALTGHPAPALSLPAERDGHTLPGTTALATSAGQPTLIVFFFTLCPHCLDSLTQVRAASLALPALRVLYVDSPAERATIVQPYVARVGVRAPILLDAGGRAAARFGAAYAPTLVLVDGHGIVRHVWIGAVSAASILRAARALDLSPAPGGRP